jgi:hypothetical protein
LERKAKRSHNSRDNTSAESQRAAPPREIMKWRLYRREVFEDIEAEETHRERADRPSSVS